MSGAATLPWASGTWNDLVKSSKSALRWDIKNSMKSLCKRLTEVGEECFIVTVNVNNGWVGHIGTLKGDEYVENRSQIVWDFLEYCRVSDCMNTSSPNTTDESDVEEEENQSHDQPHDQTGNQTGKQTDDSESTESDEWEPDEYVPQLIQSDRNLRPRDKKDGCEILIQEMKPSDQHRGSYSSDQQKKSRSLIPEALIEKVKEEMKQKRLSHQRLLEANKSPVPNPSTSKSPQPTEILQTQPRKSPQNKSPLRKQISYMRSKKRLLRAARQHSKDGGNFKANLKIKTVADRNNKKPVVRYTKVKEGENLKPNLKCQTSKHFSKVREKLFQCPHCPRRFKHEGLYHRHIDYHNLPTVTFETELN